MHEYFCFGRLKTPNYEYVQTIGTLLNTYLAILFFFEEGRKYRREAPEIIERRDSSERRKGRAKQTEQIKDKKETLKMYQSSFSYVDPDLILKIDP